MALSKEQRLAAYYYPHIYATIASGRKWIPYNWLKKISYSLVEMGIHKGGVRAIITAPPRHGKTNFLSHWLPIWYLDRFRQKRVILSTYGQSLASSFGRKIRNEIDSNDFIGVKTSQDSFAADRFDTTDGGSMVAISVGGAITGRGTDCLLIDDPYKNLKEANSRHTRETIEEWFDYVARTRLEPGGNIIMLMTRWHDDDLVSYLNKKGGYTELSFPAISDSGDALCPERYAISDLMGIKQEIGSHAFSALYQQRPTIRDGSIIKREWVKFYEALPAKFDTVIQSWDMAFKGTDQSDFVVGQVWGKANGQFYLIDQVRGQMDFSSTLVAVKTLSAKHPMAVKKVIEAKANGEAVISALRSEVPGMVPYTPKDSKQGRLASVSPLFEAGNVFLPDPSISPWVHDLIEELIGFPNMKNDDQCDAMSQGLINFLFNSGGDFTDEHVQQESHSIALSDSTELEW